MTSKRKYIAIIVVLVFGILILCLVYYKKRLPDPPSYMDMTLTVEVDQRQEVLDALLSESEEVYAYENPESLGSSFVPEGAWCYDICSANGNAVYISYQWKGVRYIVCYHGTGVRKDARVLDENNKYYKYAYGIDSETKIVECENTELRTVYWWQWWKR